MGHLTTQLTGLVAEETRQSAARELARLLNCERICVYVHDADTRLPAAVAGMPWVQGHGPEWRRLLRSDLPRFTQAMLPHPDSGDPVTVSLVRADEGTVLAAVGGEPKRQRLERLAPLLALVGVAIRGDQARALGQLHTAAARTLTADLRAAAQRRQAMDEQLQAAHRTQNHLHADAEVAKRRIAELESEVRRLEEEALQAGRVKDDFLATLSHELRTPLNAMLGWIQLLRLHVQNPQERTHALDVLERNARTQVQIVADLLDVSRVVTGKMRLVFERVDLPDIVAMATEGLHPTAAAKGVTLAIDTAPVPGIVFGDPARLQQIVWNLVSNAVKFTPGGGTVTVRLRAAGSTAELVVTDTGIGMHADVVPHVFERFRQADSSLTRRFGGLGLGLAIVRHLVELHGGTVEAASEGPELGSTFTVRLPFRPTGATASPTEQARMFAGGT